MIDPQTAIAMAKEAAFNLAQGDPLGAAKTLARAIKGQPRGGKLSVCRILAEAIAQDEAGFIEQLAADMARLAATKQGTR